MDRSQQPSPAMPANRRAFLADADSALVTAVLRKDRKATAEFVNRYADAIHRYLCARMSPRLDLVDDMVQETFMAAWENLEKYRGESPLDAWMIGIARHKVEDYYRGVLRQPQSVSDFEDDDLADSSALTIETVIDRKKLQEKTQRILAKLATQYTVVLLWRYWEQRPVREIAAQTGRTEKAIERLLARARTQFRERWNEE